MFGLSPRRPADRKRKRLQPSLEPLDVRIVPAAIDARVLAARGAAERAINGGGFAPSGVAFNNVQRFNNAVDRLTNLAQTRLTRIANRFNTGVNTLNRQFLTQVINAAAGNIGEFTGPGRVTANGTAFLNRFNALVSDPAFVSQLTTNGDGTATLSPIDIGQFTGPGRVTANGTAFLNRFNTQVQRLSTQLNRQLNAANNQINTQLARMNTQFGAVGGPFSTAVTDVNNAFSTNVAQFNTALRTGLNLASTNFRTGLTNFNTVFQNNTNLNAADTAAFRQFATAFGTQFGQFNTQFNSALNGFGSALNQNFNAFNTTLNTGLGSFYSSLNSNFINPSPGFGLPSFAVNPGFNFNPITTSPANLPSPVI